MFYMFCRNTLNALEMHFSCFWYHHSQSTYADEFNTIVLQHCWMAQYLSHWSKLHNEKKKAFDNTGVAASWKQIRWFSPETKKRIECYTYKHLETRKHFTIQSLSYRAIVFKECYVVFYSSSSKITKLTYQNKSTLT